MPIKEVKLAAGELNKLASKSPVRGIAELIWNALDADANEVTVEFETAIPLGTELIRGITIRDDGHGIENADEAFLPYGGSTKKHRERSPGNRKYHGKHGRGRFIAFCLGGKITWDTVFQDGDDKYRYQVKGRRGAPKLDFSDPVDAAKLNTGTSVLIQDVNDSVANLCIDELRDKLVAEFAIYLSLYRDIQIVVDRQPLDPASLVKEDTQVGTFKTHVEGDNIPWSLRILDWNRALNTGKGHPLYLCDDDHFPLDEQKCGRLYPLEEFSAFVVCERARVWEEENTLTDLHVEYRTVLRDAREKVQHFLRDRAHQRLVESIRHLKEEGLYPYDRDPRNLVEKTERAVFDLIAHHVIAYLPKYDRMDQNGQRLLFTLLKNSLESHPETLTRILIEVLKLSAEDQKSLAGLLDHTSLSSLIKGAKTVGDRFLFLETLEMAVFKYKKFTKERSQLHKLLEPHCWLFGEEFNLTVSDKSLSEVLEKHREYLDQDMAEADEQEVLDDEGRRRIVDLFVSRKRPGHNEDRIEHLVIELKRPAVHLGFREVNQIKKYANAVISDDRFAGLNVDWTFWLVGNKVKEELIPDLDQENLPPGCIRKSSGRYGTQRILVRTWAEILKEARARLEFFEDQFSFEVSSQGLTSYLQGLEQILPEEMLGEQDVPETSRTL